MSPAGARLAGSAWGADCDHAGYRHDGAHVFGNQMGARQGYHPKNKGKKSYQPILTFLAETREYVSGQWHNGDCHTGAEIARHLKGVFAALPAQVEKIFARADSGFYGWPAVAA